MDIPFTPLTFGYKFFGSKFKSETEEERLKRVREEAKKSRPYTMKDDLYWENVNVPFYSGGHAWG